MKIEPKLNIQYNVIAYNESFGGYGDNASHGFTDEQEAIKYAKSLDQELYNPKVWKRITMDPICIEIDFTK